MDGFLSSVTGGMDCLPSYVEVNDCSIRVLLDVISEYVTEFDKIMLPHTTHFTPTLLQNHNSGCVWKSCFLKFSQICIVVFYMLTSHSIEMYCTECSVRCFNFLMINQINI